MNTNENKELSTSTGKGVSAEDAIIATCTTQEKMFAHHYLEDYSWTNAAKKAGFAKGRGIGLYRQENIRVFIGSLQAVRQQRSLVTAEWLEMELMQQLDVAKGNVKVNQLTAQGIAHKAKKYDGPTALRITETLAKSTDYFTEEKKDHANVNISIDFSKLCHTPPDISVKKDTWNEGETYDG